MDGGRGAEVSAARMRFVRLSRASAWIVLALVAGGSLWSQPALAVNALFVGLAGVFVVALPLVAHTSLVAAEEKRRLLLEQLLQIALLAALIVVAGAPLRSLVLTLGFPVAMAPLLIGRQQARVVLGAGIGAAAVIELAAWPAAQRSVIVEAAAVICLLTFVHYVSSELVQLCIAMHRRIVSLLDRDPLTRALNFPSFIALGARIHDQATTARRPYGVLIVDIENLKAINERFGYSAGSRAIQLVAMAIERLREPDELMARYDGDKLAVLLPQLEGSRAADLAQRIRNVVFATTLNAETQVVRIKANVGIARYPVDATTLDALLARAEADMRLDRSGREPPKTKPSFTRRSGTKSG